MDFVFYDFETTGISPAFDQPTQFAAIRTDESLNELARVEIRCRISPHIIPGPHALLMTGVHPKQLVDPELPSCFGLAQELSDLTEKWAPAIWAGYNSVRFDEEVLRQLLYQNLQPEIFATQFNGNTRFDILSAVYAAYVRSPRVLDWPAGDNGRISFRLDRLAPANGLKAHKAHDSMGDVEATLHIARKISDGDPSLWAELLDNAHRKRVQGKLEQFRPLELIERTGGGEPHAMTGCFCGYSASNRALAGFLDLDMEDPERLISAEPARIHAAVTDSPRLIRGVSTNRAPALLDSRKTTAEHNRCARLIAGAAGFRRHVADALARLFAENPANPPKPVERQIYDGFYSRADKRLLRDFQNAGWRKRRDLVAEFSDSRLRQLGRRLIAFHKPELLPSGDRQRYSAYLSDKWNAPDTPETEWMTLAKARAAVAEIRAKGNAGRTILEEIETFIERVDTQPSV